MSIELPLIAANAKSGYARMRAMAIKKKNAAAVALGRLGGSKKVPKGLAQLSPEKRTAIAKQGAAKRWAKAKPAKKAKKEK